MKQLFIIGNWKSNKTVAETIEWLRFMKDKKSDVASLQNKTLIVCVPFTLLYTVSSYIKEYALSIKVGAQDISPFDEGAYTGEINGKQLKEFADYVIIGHSERRRYFQENDDVLGKKVILAKHYGLEPIYCVPDKTSDIPSGLSFVAYEPLDAISTSGAHPILPEEANAAAGKISVENQITHPLYGGSVTPENVNRYSAMHSIHGFLIGGASLDPAAFLSLAHHA